MTAARRWVLEFDRQTQRRRFWSESEIMALRSLYSAPLSEYVNVTAFSKSIGRTPAGVFKKAWALGLANPSRRTKPPRQDRRKYRTRDELLSGLSESRRRWIAEHGHPRGALGMKHRPEVIEASRQRVTKMWEVMTQEQLKALIAKRNQTNIARYGTAAPSFLHAETPYSRTKGGKRADLNDQFFRSAWEANYARYLTFLVAQGEINRWEYEAQTFVFPGVTRGVLTYTPDFRVTGPDSMIVFHEVKGWLDPKSKAKLKRMAKFYPDVIVRLVGESEYRTLNRQCRGLIAGWE